MTVTIFVEGGGAPEGTFEPAAAGDSVAFSRRRVLRAACPALCPLVLVRTHSAISKPH